jgi:hypothetical protein
MPSRIGTIGVFFLVAVGISSCNDECSGVYHCPNITMSIFLPADISSRVRSATGDTCKLTVDASDGSIGITSTTMHPCLVRVVLDDGSIEESTVTFVQLHCCGYTVRGTPVEPADGGAKASDSVPESVARSARIGMMSSLRSWRPVMASVAARKRVSFRPTITSRSAV